MGLGRQLATLDLKNAKASQDVDKAGLLLRGM